MKFISNSYLLTIFLALFLVGCSYSRPTQETYFSNEYLFNYYSNLQASYLARGFLKGNEQSDTINFNADILARNFENIALYDEYIIKNGRYVFQTTPSKLRKWLQPIRVKVIHGESIPETRRESDYQLITEYFDRIGSLIKHPIVFTDNNPNFFIIVMNVEEYRSSRGLIQAEVGKTPKAVEESIIASSPRVLCSAYTITRDKRSSEFIRAIVALKDEQRGIMRESCVHEEIAQAMGLVNDSYIARPSIFNDDEEFAFLTRHDELLLQILYDDRIELGMKVEEARPIVRQIAGELVAAEPKSNL
ncbi:MAG: DUF2927 domain-containing protein [Rhodobacteraceae bacterium]|nr:DUF2927 domain-containing protein [Paracoccaceae bacterium]